MLWQGGDLLSLPKAYGKNKTMETFPQEYIWQWPVLAAVIATGLWLIKHYTSQTKDERASYKDALEKITKAYADSGKDIMSACENNTERMLKFMEDQDIRWRQTMNTRDDLFFERIKGLETAIREVRDGKS